MIPLPEALRFGPDGLVPAIVQDVTDGTVLMLAFMNEEALELTRCTGYTHFWSRSRQALWKKGETSGNLQTVVEMMTDCDQDALLLKVRVAGHDATCHTGRRSCFYRAVRRDKETARLEIVDDHHHFNAEEVYNK